MKEKRFKEIVSEGIADLFYIWWQELKAVVKDQGVLIFFILVPLGYPLLYTFIYTNETVREVPAVVVDNNRSTLSREYLRLVDAGPDLHIVSHCADMEEAKALLKEVKAYGIIYIPELQPRYCQRHPDPRHTLLRHERNVILQSHADCQYQCIADHEQADKDRTLRQHHRASGRSQLLTHRV